MIEETTKEDILYFRGLRKRNLTNIIERLHHETDAVSPGGMSKDRLLQVILAACDVGNTTAYSYIRTLLGKEILTEQSNRFYKSSYAFEHRREIWEHLYPPMPKAKVEVTSKVD